MNEKKIATIYDYKRMCKTLKGDCRICPLRKLGSFVGCNLNINSNIDSANDIILKWCEEHPTKTRQSEFLKLFPNAAIDSRTNNIDICPKVLDQTIICKNFKNCLKCSNKYWFQEVE